LKFFFNRQAQPSIAFTPTWQLRRFVFHAGL
jgi:hypothetical protein